MFVLNAATMCVSFTTFRSAPIHAETHASSRPATSPYERFPHARRRKHPNGEEAAFRSSSTLL
jgi:hypothetical protein